MQVVEALPRNSGRDRVPVFIYRQKVPRAVEPLPRPGDIAKHTVLNVFGDLLDGYYILDRLKVYRLQLTRLSTNLSLCLQHLTVRNERSNSGGVIVHTVHFVRSLHSVMLGYCCEYSVYNRLIVTTISWAFVDILQRVLTSTVALARKH